MLVDLRAPIEGAPNISWSELTHTVNRDFIWKNRQVPIVLQAAGEAIARKAQAIRDHYGRPLIVHSGYRYPALNAAIKGDPRSQHMKFEAIDFHILGVSLQEVFHWIWKESGMEWGQLIAEGWDPTVGDISWIHLSLGHPYRAAERSQQVKYRTFRDGATPWTELQ